jgi:hypothetical protein
MANININVEPFQCTPIVLNSTYRDGQKYQFNWETLGQIYEDWGMDVNIKLFYLHEQTPPEIEYTSQTIPYNADFFIVDQLPSHDSMSFRLQLTVEGECVETVDIPYSSIIQL